MFSSFRILPDVFVLTPSSLLQSGANGDELVSCARSHSFCLSHLPLLALAVDFNVADLLYLNTDHNLLKLRSQMTTQVNVARLKFRVKGDIQV